MTPTPRCHLALRARLTAQRGRCPDAPEGVTDARRREAHLLDCAKRNRSRAEAASLSSEIPRFMVTKLLAHTLLWRVARGRHGWAAYKPEQDNAKPFLRVDSSCGHDVR